MAAAPFRDEVEDQMSFLRRDQFALLPGAVLSVDLALNTCVIRTLSGMAGAVCASIDGMNWDGILGTIAGDDTIFVLCRTETKARNFRDAINTLIGK